jgi:hypothetical protein
VIRARLASLIRGQYPTAVAVAFVVDETASNGVALAAAWRALAVAVLIGIALVAIGRLVTRDRERGSLFALAILLALLAGDGPLPLVGSAAILLVLYADLRLRRRGRSLPWARIDEAATLVGGLIVVLVSLPLISATLSRPSPAAPALVGSTAAARPDIYLVMLDGFGRSDVLAESYGHDTRKFVTELQERGFRLSPDSRSNYPVTGLALTSMLNAEPLSALGFSPTTSTEPRDVHPYLENNRSFPLLAAAGYETVAFTSGYELVALRSAHRFIDTGELNELEVDLIGETILEQPLGALVGDSVKMDSIRRRTLATVPAVAALAAEPSTTPRFVFVHLPMPHPPFVFGPDCEAVPGSEPYYMLGDDGVPRKPPDRYAAELALTADQAACTERLAIETVDGILAGAGKDAVVIVFSDHGPDTTLNWFDPQQPAIAQRLDNFFAARTPGHDGLFRDDITLVNVMPALFRTYLGVDLPDQPDTSYFRVPGEGLVAVDAPP